LRRDSDAVVYFGKTLCFVSFIVVQKKSTSKLTLSCLVPYPFTKVPITIVGFVVSAAWLDLIADKLVSILSFFGIILHIPSTIMGITILAWGNSSQDMIANMTVAKKGLSAMAMTASFAGPVFNILVGLGIGFSILIQTGNHGEPIPVSLNNPLRVGFLFAVLNGVLVIVSGTCIGKGTIPKKYGYAAIALYVVYAVVTLMI
jgi:sodium/potassium/calcium exchanger 6